MYGIQQDPGWRYTILHAYTEHTLQVEQLAPTDGRTASADYCTDGFGGRQETLLQPLYSLARCRGVVPLGILPSLEYHGTGTKGDPPPDGMCDTRELDPWPAVIFLSAW